MLEIDTNEKLHSLLAAGDSMYRIIFQDMDLIPLTEQLKGREITECLFLGCPMSRELEQTLRERGNLIFPNLKVPFRPYRGTLYTANELYRGFDPEKPDTIENTPDAVIYRHYLETGKDTPPSIYESIARRLHDHSITDALHDITDAVPERNIVAVMGGHSLLRTDPDYRKVVMLSKSLVEKGYFMLSGGGPGAMDAAHLGAWCAKREETEVDDILGLLAGGPDYKNREWLSAAFRVMERYPCRTFVCRDIGIPTWHYGHEPATPFASKIAKYFANSVREEGLLALAKGGIVYTPGSAGTIQEIFQDAAQNHYSSYGFPSPMVFLDTAYWTKTKPVYPLLRKLAEGRPYEKLLSITDDSAEAVRAIERFSAAV
ncbi:MAG: hypothetical protein JW881_03830 [Spirochaetales bacterium]|nr:hypothetical protein [Spirochaetales bacterium]